MSNPHVANLEYQVKQSRAVKRLEADNGRMRSANERLRGLLREARAYVPDPRFSADHLRERIDQELGP